MRYHSRGLKLQAYDVDPSVFNANYFRPSYLMGWKQRPLLDRWPPLPELLSKDITSGTVAATGAKMLGFQ